MHWLLDHIPILWGVLNILVVGYLILFYEKGKHPRHPPDLTPEQKLKEALALCRKHGVRFDRQKLDALIEEHTSTQEHKDQLSMLFEGGVVMAETREEAAARQEREQKMFGQGVPRATAGKEE